MRCKLFGKLQLVLEEGINCAVASHLVDDLPDDNTMNDCANHHSQRHVHDLTSSEGGNISEADCGEDGKNEVHRMCPLVEGIAIHQSFLVDAHEPTRQPGLVRLLMQGGTEVPAASHDMHHPDQPEQSIQHRHNLVSLDIGVEVQALCQLGYLHKPEHADDLCHPLHPHQPQSLLAAACLKAVFASKEAVDGTCSIFRDAGNRIDPKPAG
mmetsp:Transcript_3323/g.7853  ORF Transcript_3323/g.7853 Transcript_3323/m.7853 type:complete len:210 (-) Transcript_3323:189-818(-)